MSNKSLTHPGLYIIETLALSDEESVTSEGSMIYQILSLAGVRCVYKYVRTVQEFRCFIGDFVNSGYRYLHISCHGSSDSIATTLENIPFAELAKILGPRYLDNRRLFLSACLATNEKLADLILNKTNCYSIIGHDKKIRMDSAAIFWSSFYFAMLADNQTKMHRQDVKAVLKQCSRLYHLPVNYFTKNSNSEISSITIQNGREIKND